MRLLETKAKKRILISVLAALAALLLAAGAFYAWRAVSFEREVRALTESAGLESTAVSVREKTGLLSLRRALEREQTAHDTRAAALSARAEEFTSSLFSYPLPLLRIELISAGISVSLKNFCTKLCTSSRLGSTSGLPSAGMEAFICVR